MVHNFLKRNQVRLEQPCSKTKQVSERSSRANPSRAGAAGTRSVQLINPEDGSKSETAAVMRGPGQSCHGPREGLGLKA